MNLNALQKYILKIFVVVIIFFTFCVPTLTASGHLGYGFIFIDGTVNAIAYTYLAYEFIGITLATLALVLACKEVKKK